MTYETIYQSLITISAHCRTQRQAAGCSECVFLRFCEMIADGEIVPLETIIDNLMLLDVAEALAAERREETIWPKE